jgi:flavin reductase (DIM6/NTAB) family NADH-FMN oxidoreductase RutF
MDYKTYTAEDILGLDTAVRRDFFPKVSGIRSAAVIGTQNAQGQTNAALFNTLTHIGSNPPLLGIVFRPLTVPRHTYSNIKETGIFTINLPHSTDIDAVHHTSAKYLLGQSEFIALGKEEVYHDGFEAPFWPDSPIQIGLRYEEEHLIKANDTILLIGRVELLRIDEKLVDQDGRFQSENADLLLVNGLDSYFKGGFLRNKPYARPS